MVVADGKNSLQITGNGDVLEPHDGIIGAPHALHNPFDAHAVHSVRSALGLCVCDFLRSLADPCDAVHPTAAIGSGGAYAGAAARALRDVPDYDALRIGARRRLCVL